MAKVYVFENTDAGEAANLTGTDYLVFANSDVNASNVTVSASAGVNSPVTLTADGMSLTFAGQALSTASQAGNVQFDDGSALVIGVNTTTADTIDQSAATTSTVIYGLAGDDTITGSDNGDYIYGGLGADSVVGGTGNDHIYGNALTTTQGTDDGADHLFGGDGRDYIQGNAGADTIEGDLGSDRLVGGAGNDSILGGDGVDTVQGNQGNDIIDGGDGNDILRGGQGTDSVFGGTGNDIIYGDAGNDTVNGGAGLDVLFGGDGSDTFLFNPANYSAFGTSGTNAFVVDTIGDYVDGTDKIVFGTGVGPIPAVTVLQDTTGSTFANLAAANTYAQTLISGATSPGEEVAAISVGSDTYLFHSTNGSAVDFVLKVAGVNASAFTASDFTAVA